MPRSEIVGSYGGFIPNFLRNLSIDEMDKEAVVHIHNGILLSHKKEHIWVSSDEVDEPRTCYSEWSKLERER